MLPGHKAATTNHNPCVVLVLVSARRLPYGHVICVPLELESRNQNIQATLQDDAFSGILDEAYRNYLNRSKQGSEIGFSTQSNFRVYSISFLGLLRLHNLMLFFCVFFYFYFLFFI